MSWAVRAAIVAAGLVAIAAGPGARAAAPLMGPLPPALTSFGAPLNSYSALSFLAGTDAPLYADPASLVLSPTLALDSAGGGDISQRFLNFGNRASPFATPITQPFMALADGGRYAGVTSLAWPGVTLRFGASARSDRLDDFHILPVTDAFGLPVTEDVSRTRSFLAGLSWNVTDRAGLDFSAISSSRSGVPELASSSLNIADKAQTNAMGVSAHLGLGDNWVSSISYSAGISQLDLKSEHVDSQEQTYSIAIAKRDVFAVNDALGFALSRPAPGMLGSFSSLNAAGDMPPVVIANAMQAGANQETDFQLGYVTMFLNGKLALQTNAAYQVNVQGQGGANAVSALARAKIKF